MTRHLRLAWSERIARERFEVDHGELVRDELAIEAGTSWRPYDSIDWMHLSDIVIGGDSGNARRRSFDIYIKGRLDAIRPSLAEAQQYITEHYGEVEWSRVRLPLVTVNHPYGPTTEFTDPKVIYCADLPRPVADLPRG